MVDVRERISAHGRTGCAERADCAVDTAVALELCEELPVTIKDGLTEADAKALQKKITSLGGNAKAQASGE